MAGVVRPLSGELWTSLHLLLLCQGQSVRRPGNDLGIDLSFVVCLLVVFFASILLSVFIFLLFSKTSALGFSFSSFRVAEC